MLRRIWQKWQVIGHFIGNLVARVVLTIFYFTIMAPFGIGTSLFSDRLGIKSIPSELWQTRTTGVDTLESMRRQA